MNATTTSGRAALFLLLALAVGCSMQDFGGAGSELTELTTDPAKQPAAQAEARAEQLSRVLMAWKQQQQGQGEDEYRIGPEDVLDISVFALERPGQPATLARRVNVSGNVNLPFVGDVHLAGRTTREAIQAVVAAYADKYLRNPQVDVTITEFRGAPVVVTGAVKQPGIYYLRRRSSSVLEMLSLANGLATEAGHELLIVRGEPATTNAAPTAETPDRPADAATDAELDTEPEATTPPAEQMVSIDLRRLLDSGDILLNAPVHGGDVITVPPRRAQYVYVLGYVQRPGALELRQDQELQALQAVAMAGGLSGSARAQNSTLITETNGLRQTRRVDLTSMKRGQEMPAVLKPGDILIVGSSSIAKFAEFIKLSAGASYTPTP